MDKIYSLLRIFIVCERKIRASSGQDTNPKIKDMEIKPLGKNAVNTITKGKYGIVIKNGSEEIVYKYADFGLDKVNFNNEVIDIFIKELSVIKYFMIPVIIIIKFIDMLFYSFMMSLAGMLSMLFNKQRLSYGNIFKLAMYSITAPTLLGLILPLGKYTMFIGGLILIFGINFVVYDDIIKVNKDNM